MNKSDCLPNADKESSYLVDSHCHLETPVFNSDRDNVIDKAKKAGVRYFLTVGCSLEDWDNALAIAERHPEVYAALGIHPHDASGCSKEIIEQLKSKLKSDKVVAVGEMGLDFYRNLSPKPAQINAFRRQLAVAEESGMPVIIHDRDAHKETLKILKSQGKGRLRGIIHCFSGDMAMAEECLALGFYISVPGTLTYSRNKTLRQVIARVPLERILVETDSPYLTPEPLRGRLRRNEPASVRLVAETLAQLHKCTLEEIARITSQNAQDLFGIGK